MNPSSSTPTPQQRKTILTAVAVALFVTLAMWFVWLFMGDDAALRMSIARIMLIFVGLVCLFLFGCMVFVAISIARRRR
jgi:membrane protein YdbS with pleckstrin-like domain